MYIYISHLKTEIDPVSETLFASYLEFLTMEKVWKPSDSECYTPSSEPFRVYWSKKVK
jgi:hypothetical protein